jgi:hypothetical protein
VVQHDQSKWIGVVDYIDDQDAVVKWLDRDARDAICDPRRLIPIDGWEFEAALTLGDNTKVLEMYRAAQTAERERDKVRASYNAIHEIVLGEWFRTFPEYAFDGGQLPYHIKRLVDALRADLDTANVQGEAIRITAINHLRLSTSSTRRALANALGESYEAPIEGDYKAARGVFADDAAQPEDGRAKDNG